MEYSESKGDVSMKWIRTECGIVCQINMKYANKTAECINNIVDDFDYNTLD